MTQLLDANSRIGWTTPLSPRISRGELQKRHSFQKARFFSVPIIIICLIIFDQAAQALIKNYECCRSIIPHTKGNRVQQSFWEHILPRQHRRRNRQNWIISSKPKTWFDTKEALEALVSAFAQVLTYYWLPSKQKTRITSICLKCGLRCNSKICGNHEQGHSAWLHRPDLRLWLSVCTRRERTIVVGVSWSPLRKTWWCGWTRSVLVWRFTVTC